VFLVRRLKVRRKLEGIPQSKLTTKRVRCSVEADVLLAQPKVGDLHVTVLVQQQILQLDVTVDDVLRVQIPSQTMTTPVRAFNNFITNEQTYPRAEMISAP
jgi:hypothetical protein